MPIRQQILTQRVPVKIWSSEVEATALQQLRDLASLPVVYHHVAVMPDVHFGKGTTVGAVIATERAIIPAAVGVDIGCGMMAVKTGLEAAQVSEKLARIRARVEASIPLGFDDNGRNQTESVARWKGWKDPVYTDKLGPELKVKARAQLGSLGGGNHFIELSVDTEGALWLMLHSGSRGVGNLLASRHIREAKNQCQGRGLDLPNADLAYFTEGSEGFDSYLEDLHWCQSYAWANREEMMERLVRVVERETGEGLERLLEVHCHHNYTAQETHFGKRVWLSRKGAVKASRGERGIIPGSMGTPSFIVEGLGNPESFESCSHGAGRRMSRSAARRQFTVEDLRKQTEGVESRKDAGVLDEIPGAYKDIARVMEDQSDLARPLYELKQVMTVKG